MSSKPELVPELMREAQRVIAHHGASKARMALAFLRYLIASEVAGKFASNGFDSTDSRIVLDFYIGWAMRKQSSPFHDKAAADKLCYEDIEQTADKLRRRVRGLLKKFYEDTANQTGVRLLIEEGRDRFRPYLTEVSIEFISEVAAAASRNVDERVAPHSVGDKGSLTIAPVWKTTDA